MSVSRINEDSVVLLVFSHFCFMRPDVVGMSSVRKTPVSQHFVAKSQPHFGPLILHNSLHLDAIVSRTLANHFLFFQLRNPEAYK